ncbi:Tetraspanin-13 [Blomia tropicalis]|nr:Tetraspanin-13 [Blomia tropicalis]
MCGGFTCTGNALKALNILYSVLSLILMTVAILMIGRVPEVANGTLVCAIFLFMLSLLGFVGTVKHHQVILFFYMVILFVLFLGQFGISCILLASTTEQQHELVQNHWNSSTIEGRQRFQQNFDCCGFHTDDSKSSILCPSVRCCQSDYQMGQCVQCDPCEIKMQQTMADAFNVFGWLGLLFSLTQFAGVWLTIRFRNQKNPRANSNAFL